MKSYLIQTLKELALLGAIKNKIEISSQELSNRLNCSQQTSARYLLELDKKDMITRELGIKKQLILITKKGVDVLSSEHSDYQQIFDLTDRIFFKGKIVSGLGEGRYYTEQSYYKKQFREKIGFIPYPGTLNVEIEYIEKNKLRLLRKYDSIIIEGFEDKKRTFGGVRCFRAEVEKVPSALVLPLRSHYSNILEFISEHYLRDKLSIEDGDTVETIIYL